MKKLRLGFIGAGFVGQVGHISCYKANPDCELVALAEVKPELRKQAQAHYGFRRSYENHHELLEDGEIDAVVAVTRRQNTGPVALDVLRAGKPLLTEKPACHSVEQGERLLAEATKNGVPFAVGYMRRFDENFLKLLKHFKELLDAGGWGPVHSIHSQCFGGNSYVGAKAAVPTDMAFAGHLEEWALAPSWVPEKERSAYASFVNVFCHDVNLLNAIAKAMGTKLTVEQVSLDEKNRGIVRMSLIGIPVTLETGERGPTEDWEESLEIKFKKSSIRADFPAAFDKKAPTGWVFQKQADAFVSSVIKKQNTMPNIAEAVEDLRVIEAIWKARA